jgi:hypothetical protein
MPIDYSRLWNVTARKLIAAVIREGCVLDHQSDERLYVADVDFPS